MKLHVVALHFPSTNNQKIEIQFSFFIFNSLEFKTIQCTWYINNTGVDTGRNKILSITIFTHYAVSTGRYVDQDTEKRQTDLQ